LVLALPLLALAPPRHTARAVPASPFGVDPESGGRVPARADSVGQASPAATSPAPRDTSAPAAASSSPGSSSPGPLPAPALVAAARMELEAWQNGKLDLDHYIPELRPRLNESAVARVSTEVQGYGAVKSFSYAQRMLVQGVTVFIFRAVCANGTLDELISWNSAGKVQFIYFRPAP
jgi:hypothetical protein